MHDNRPPSGQVFLPEYATLAQIFNTLSDKVRTSGQLQMGTFLISDQVAGIMVIGGMREVNVLSRMIVAAGQSPLVKMPEKK